MLNVISICAFLLMVAGALGLFCAHSLFSYSPFVIVPQATAVALMVWARITFGFRSFHAAANPTKGGLVTNGPYKFVRHPIYAAICLFTFAGALAHISLTAAFLLLLIFVGAFVRLLVEEHLLIKRYPEYRDYASRVKRLLPFVF